MSDIKKKTGKRRMKKVGFYYMAINRSENNHSQLGMKNSSEMKKKEGNKQNCQ